MKQDDSPQIAILRKLVKDKGGPAAFAREMSRDREKTIDPTFVSQILNGHRPFGDKARRNMAIRCGLDENFFEYIPTQIQQPQANYDVSSPTISEAVRLLTEMPEHCRLEALGAIRIIYSHHLSSSDNPELRTGT